MDSSKAASSGSNVGLLFYLARRELARRYAGSVLGPVWALVFPALQIGLYWGVFRYGLRVEGRGSMPLAPILIAGMVPWFAVSEALTTMTASLRANASLVKRTALPIELLPLASFVAAASVHGAIFILALIVLWALGFAPGPHLAMIFYGALCVALLALPLGTLLALGNVAFSDVAQMIGALLLLWFWATPILWPADQLPPGWAWVANANPLTHVVDVYRYALLGPSAAHVDGTAALSFWCSAMLLTLAAWLAFRRFKREIADLL